MFSPHSSGCSEHSSVLGHLRACSPLDGSDRQDRLTRQGNRRGTGLPTTCPSGAAATPPAAHLAADSRSGLKTSKDYRRDVVPGRRATRRCQGALFRSWPPFSTCQQAIKIRHDPCRAAAAPTTCAAPCTTHRPNCRNRVRQTPRKLLWRQPIPAQSHGIVTVTERSLRQTSLHRSRDARPSRPVGNCQTTSRRPFKAAPAVAGR